MFKNRFPLAIRVRLAAKTLAILLSLAFGLLFHNSVLAENDAGGSAGFFNNLNANITTASAKSAETAAAVKNPFLNSTASLATPTSLVSMASQQPASYRSASLAAYPCEFAIGGSGNPSSYYSYSADGGFGEFVLYNIYGPQGPCPQPTPPVISGADPSMVTVYSLLAYAPAPNDFVYRGYFYVAPNLTGQPRNVAVGGYRGFIGISQGGGCAFRLQMLDYSTFFPPAGTGNQSVDIKLEASPNCPEVILSSTESWVTVTNNGNSRTMKVDPAIEGTDTGARFADIIILGAGNNTPTLRIMQYTPKKPPVTPPKDKTKFQFRTGKATTIGIRG